MSSENIYTIYTLTNILNQKIYIGFTSNIHKRLIDHKSASKSSNYKLYRAIRKHGWDNFTSEILYQSKDRVHTLTIMEPYFISEYDSYHNGYNSTLGGEGTFGRRWKIPYHLVKRGETHHNYGKPLSEETKKKISIGKLGEKNPMYGKHISDEAKIKIAEKSAKSFIIIFPDNTISKIKNLNRFCVQHNLDAANMINVANGTAESYHGYRCFYADSYIGHSINTYEFTNNTGEIFITKNMAYFCIQHSLSVPNIKQVLKGTHKSYKGWICKFVDTIFVHSTFE